MPEGSASLQLAVGDRGVYPNQGVCRVSAIDVKEVAGQKLTFVTMRREEDGAVVMVPQTKVVSIGVRKVAGAEDVRQVFEFLSSDSDKADLDWKQRARTNLERMTQGGLLGLAEVVKGLQVLSELRPLPTKERELYDNARHLLVSELAAALNVPECNAEDAIDVVLFPPGRERPKRTAAEFKVRGEGDDDLGLYADLLWLDGDSLLDVPLLERKRLLGSIVPGDELVRAGPYVRPPIATWVGSWRAQGFDGLTFKEANSRYRPGQVTKEWTVTTMPRR